VDSLTVAVECLRAGEFGAAARHLDEVLRERPNDAAALAYAGMTRLHMGLVDDAKELLDLAVEADPGEFLAWAKRGELWFQLACYPQAAVDLRHALTLAAPSAASRKWVAKMLESADQRSRMSYTRNLVLPKLPTLGRLKLHMPRLTWRLPKLGTRTTEPAVL
jgi:tetratricopeptide (TPR) repeat protein